MPVRRPVSAFVQKTWHPQFPPSKTTMNEKARLQWHAPRGATHTEGQVQFAMNSSFAIRMPVMLAHACRAIGFLKPGKAHAGAADAAVKARFLKAASHDLRQPVHAMEMFLGRLSEVRLPPHAHETVVSARECAGQLSDMLRSLLDLASLDMQPPDPQWAVVPVSSMLDTVRAQYAATAGGKGLEFSVRDSPALARTDPAMAERILLNLVGNAVCHTSRGRVLVVCRKRGKALCVEIRDTGPGIAASHLEAIFEEFWRVPQAGEAHVRGLGLGLPVAQRMALILGTTLSVRSWPGRGSLFRVDFPLVANGPQDICPSCARDGAKDMKS